MGKTRLASSACEAAEETPPPVRTLSGAELLHLAATPTFAAMALLTGTVGTGSMGTLCPVHAMPPLDGMTVMYLLMAVFHSAPWLKRVSRWRSGVQRWCSHG